MSDRTPRVVAELGRPETPEETAARKAEASRLRRVRQNTRNLVYSLLVCVGIVAIIVALVPRPDTPTQKNLDFRELASQAQAAVTQPLLAPDVPSTWKANAAQLRTNDGITSWYVGFVTPDTQYLAYTEGIDGNATWLADTLSDARGSGTVTLGGLTWRVYDERSEGTAAGNVAYALATQVGSVDIAVYGTASVKDARLLATALANEAAAHITGKNEVPAA